MGISKLVKNWAHRKARRTDEYTRDSSGDQEHIKETEEDYEPPERIKRIFTNCVETVQDNYKLHNVNYM